MCVCMYGNIYIKYHLSEPGHRVGSKAELAYFWVTFLIQNIIFCTARLFSKNPPFWNTLEIEIQLKDKIHWSLDI
jgi:hypothetical protein